MGTTGTTCAVNSHIHHQYRCVTTKLIKIRMRHRRYVVRESSLCCRKTAEKRAGAGGSRLSFERRGLDSELLNRLEDPLVKLGSERRNRAFYVRQALKTSHPVLPTSSGPPYTGFEHHYSDTTARYTPRAACAARPHRGQLCH